MADKSSRSLPLKESQHHERARLMSGVQIMLVEVTTMVLILQEPLSVDNSLRRTHRTGKVGHSPVQYIAVKIQIQT